jgi:hypothetical protein
MEIVKAENAPGFGRDTKTGAIININTSEIEAARQAKANKRKKQEEFEQLKKDVDDIKAMLTQIVEKL